MVAVDQGGNAWVTGYFQNLTDLGSGSLHSAGGNDVLLAKYSPAGAGLVSHDYGDSSDQYGVFLTVNAFGSDVALDPSGRSMRETSALPSPILCRIVLGHTTVHLPPSVQPAALPPARRVPGDRIRNR